MLRDGSVASLFDWSGGGRGVPGKSVAVIASDGERAAVLATDRGDDERSDQVEMCRSDQAERCEQLHRRLKRIVKARGALDMQEAEALREAQKLAIWRRYGYGSLVEYMEMEMGYSPRAAIERLRVANAIVELPQIAAAMEQGDLSFSGARELTRVATPETEQAWLGATAEMNARQVEAAVAGHAKGDAPEDPPDPKLIKKVLRFEVRPEVYALSREVKQKLEKVLGERVDDEQLLEAVYRHFLDEATGEGREVAPYQVAVTVCKACNRG